MALSKVSQEEILQDVLEWTGKDVQHLTEEELDDYSQFGLSVKFADREDEVKNWLLSLKKTV